MFFFSSLLHLILLEDYAILDLYGQDLKSTGEDLIWGKCTFIDLASQYVSVWCLARSGYLAYL